MCIFIFINELLRLSYCLYSYNLLFQFLLVWAYVVIVVTINIAIFINNGFRQFSRDEVIFTMVAIVVLSQGTSVISILYDSEYQFIYKPMEEQVKLCRWNCRIRPFLYTKQLNWAVCGEAVWNLHRKSRIN